MSKAPRDGVTVVIPAHNAAAALDQVLPAWGQVLTNLNRPFEIIVVNDGSTDNTAEVLAKRVGNVPHLRVLKHDTQQGFGVCLRTALAEAKQPLLMYVGVDYPYTATDIRPMLERIELRDEVFGKQPDLISGARSGQERPPMVSWVGQVWKIFWRIFAGLPINESPPWYGWEEWWYRVRVSWVYGIPLADVNSAFKLYRTEFLKRFPIQSDGDFVHTELVAKATFLTSIMDELPLTPKADPLPALKINANDERKVFREPQFVMPKPAPQPTPPETKPPEAISAPTSAEPTAPIVNQAPLASSPAASPPPATPPVENSGSMSASGSPQPSEPAKANASPPASAVGSTAPVPKEVTPASLPSTSEPAKPNESVVNPTPEPTKSESAKPVVDSTKAVDPPRDKPAETNAGGLSSPGSPIPAT